MENKSLQLDARYLSHMFCLYDALSISATDPVTINYPLDNPKRESRMFYDAYGRGDNEYHQGKEIMNQRIKNAPADIRSHATYHNVFLGCFKEIDTSIIVQDRKAVDEISQKLCTLVGEYAINIVKNHRSHLKRGAFIDYPSFKRNYPFKLRNENFYEYAECNQKNSYDDFMNYITFLRTVSNRVATENGPMPFTSVATQLDDPQSLIGSLNSRIRCNKELLSRIGFELR